MSLNSFNRGMDDAYSGAPMRLNEDPDYYQGYSYAEFPEPEPYPEPTIEELCGPEHAYAGEDEGGPRCYCGQRREFPEVAR